MAALVGGTRRVIVLHPEGAPARASHANYWIFADGLAAMARPILLKSLERLLTIS